MRAWHKGSKFGPGLRKCMAVADRAVFRAKLKLWKGCRRLTAAARDVGQVLVNMLGEDGRLDPCHQTLADLVGCTVRTVQRALDQLHQEGFVTWERRIARRAADLWEVRQVSNAYVLHLPSCNGQNVGGVTDKIQKKEAQGQTAPRHTVQTPAEALAAAGLQPPTAAEEAASALRRATRAAAGIVRDAGLWARMRTPRQTA